MKNSTEKEKSKFTILVDTAEQHPWSFRFPHLFVPTERKYLGVRQGKTYTPRADYAIKGFEGRCHIERKSPGDMQSTILGFSGRRDRFENELRVLNEMDCSAVICECSLGWLLMHPPQYGESTAQTQARMLHRTIISWQREWSRVSWWFCDTRLLAEITAYRIFESFWKHRDG